MGLLPDTQNCGLHVHRECLERFPRHWVQRKPLVSDPGMHHGTCVTHVPRCMSRSITRGGGETFPAFPVHAQPAILRIWQEVHGVSCQFYQCICRPQTNWTNFVPWWRHQMETFSALLALSEAVRRIHQSPVVSPHKGQWRGGLMFSLISPEQANKTPVIWDATALIMTSL